MTGEMGWDDIKDYPLLLALAKKIQRNAKVAAEVRPFDVYQGPFIAVNLYTPPLKGNARDRLGSWHVSIWYGTQAGTYIINYRNIITVATEKEVIRSIKQFKAEA